MDAVAPLLRPRSVVDPSTPMAPRCSPAEKEPGAHHAIDRPRRCLPLGWIRDGGIKFCSTKTQNQPSTMALSPDQIPLIKATVPVLQEHGLTITKVFYDNLLTAHPELKTVFNVSNKVHGHQPLALAGALFAYASHIDNLGVLSPAVERICHKHASLAIQPEGYQIVGKFLLEAMGQVLGDALTPPLLDAWATAYWQLANLMINKEAELYKAANGWTDFRDFRIARKEPESDVITSFYLEPVDGQPLPSFLPGQYVSIQVPVPQLDHAQCRQYSLSDQPQPSYYRISVRKDPGLNAADPSAPAHPGYVSNLLHDQLSVGDLVKLSHPYGDFHLTNPTAAHPLVLISAGVGLTPLTSMVNALTAAASDTNTRPIHFIHGAHSSSSRAFQAHLQSLTTSVPNLRTTYFLTVPGGSDQEGVNYNHAGRVNLAKLDGTKDLFLDNAETEYYVCGPTAFMVDIQKALVARGVDAARVHMELFGTGGVPAA
ncbi:globin-like protein [Aspergillus egyptiacus]|nr:globin-like protein [Aspergillus egyptiacus]